MKFRMLEWNLEMLKGNCSLHCEVIESSKGQLKLKNGCFAELIELDFSWGMKILTDTDWPQVGSYHSRVAYLNQGQFFPVE